MKEETVYNQVSERCSALQRTLTASEYVSKLEQLLAVSENREEITSLRDNLAFGYVRVGRLENARELYLKNVEEDSSNEMSYAKLANHLLYLAGDGPAALEVIEKAEKLARQNGRFLRMILGQKARIALSLQRYDILNYCLDEIPRVTLGLVPLDVGRERDFFDKADKTKIDEEVRRKFLMYLA